MYIVEHCNSVYMLKTLPLSKYIRYKNNFTIENDKFSIVKIYHFQFVLSKFSKLVD